MPLSDYENLTEADFVGLPPLVPEGANRKEVLAGVIDRWIKTSHELAKKSFYSNFETIESYEATLKKVDLRDGNKGADPIDLGRDLLIPFMARFLKEMQKNDEKKSIPGSVPIPIYLIGCKVYSIAAGGLKLPGNFALLGCLVEGDANFIETTFRGEAYFRETTFNSRAKFHRTTFSNWADFRKVNFNEQADFRKTTFDDGANYRKATFSGEVNFHNGFFCKGANFIQTTFSGLAYFRETTFINQSLFYNADLRTANLAHGYLPLQQDEEWKYSWTLLPASTLQKHLSKTWDKNLWPFLSKHRDRNSISGAPSWAFHKIRLLKEHFRKHIDWQYLWDRIEWRWVRSLGELTALTRVSYLSLIGVPLLAGLWKPAQTWILRMNGGIKQSSEKLREVIGDQNNTLGMIDIKSQEFFKIIKDSETKDALPLDLPLGELHEEIHQQFLNLSSYLVDSQEILSEFGSATIETTMPVGWLLAFLASFFVVIAQLIYQIWAPKLIRLSTEEELIEESNELIRRGDPITNNWLRESVDYLRDAWQRMPHRHNAWFVQRGLRTVWIPNNVEEHFKDAEEDIIKPDDAPKDWKPPLVQQEVLAEDRKRIAIEEGEKARYAIEVFTNRKAAWLSGGFYIVGGFLSAMIILRQLSYVLAVSAVSDWASIPRYLSDGWFVFGFTIFLLALTFIGWWFVKEPTKPETAS